MSPHPPARSAGQVGQLLAMIRQSMINNHDILRNSDLTETGRIRYFGVYEG